MIGRRRAPAPGPRHARAIGARLALASTLVVAAGLGAAPAAQAYVRYKTDSGKPFQWKQTCVPVTFYPDTMIDVAGAMAMTPEQISHAVRTAAETWSSNANPCSFLQINADPPMRADAGVDASAPAPAKAVYDKRNALIFQTVNWAFDSQALAITSVFVLPSDGTIKDADIEINSVNFIWADVDLDHSSNRQDLQNALTHEMGHLLGLDHTCYTHAANTTRPLDDMGLPIPDCNDSAPADVKATTMYASAKEGDTQKRTLAPDELRAICAMYPVANDPHTCPMAGELNPSPPSASGCTCAVHEGRSGVALSTLVGLAALVTRARRRRRGSTR
ncbi:MAG: hypothetical protein JWM82_2840 [Myxococcales bacterium]|nr:hypothetical protein [Myxococcales bacterium]